MSFSDVHLPGESGTPWIGPRGQRMQRLELHLTYTCAERCVFCSEAARMRRFQRFRVTWGRVAKILRSHAARGVTSVHFTGGEPTIHPQFVKICVLAKKLGLRTSIGTIGTMLAREDFARRALPHLDEALFSLHGPEAALHDRLAGREGSFETVCRAITLAQELRPDFRVYVNTVVTQHNVERLPETVALAARLGAQLIIVSNTTPEGDGQARYDELAVPLPRLGEILPQVPAHAGDAVLRFFGVPMCVLGEHRLLSNDVHWDPRVTVEWVEAPGKVVLTGLYNWEPKRLRVRPAGCEPCAMKELCMGVYGRYLDRFGAEGLRAYSTSIR